MKEVEKMTPQECINFLQEHAGEVMSADTQVAHETFTVVCFWSKRPYRYSWKIASWPGTPGIMLWHAVRPLSIIIFIRFSMQELPAIFQGGQEQSEGQQAAEKLHLKTVTPSFTQLHVQEGSWLRSDNMVAQR